MVYLWKHKIKIRLHGKSKTIHFFDIFAYIFLSFWREWTHKIFSNTQFPICLQNSI